MCDSGCSTRTKTNQLDFRNECYYCVSKQDVPGNAHIQCLNPTPEVFEKGDEWGKKNGWFFYPYLFDPVWKGAPCPNFEKKE